MGKQMKCDICGSTTVDHTEKDCRVNRSLKVTNKSSSKSKSAPYTGYTPRTNPGNVIVLGA